MPWVQAVGGQWHKRHVPIRVATKKETQDQTMIYNVAYSDCISTYHNP